jgi:N-formylglutamate amidohydrolase
LRPDFIVGDRFGTSASALIEAWPSACWRDGLYRAHNKPYAGGFITEHYGRPARGLHALQIEINRGHSGRRFRSLSACGRVAKTTASAGGAVNILEARALFVHANARCVSRVVVVRTVGRSVIALEVVRTSSE